MVKALLELLYGVSVTRKFFGLYPWGKSLLLSLANKGFLTWHLIGQPYPHPAIRTESDLKIINYRIIAWISMEVL